MFDMLGYPLYTPQEERLNNEAHVYFRPSSLPGKIVGLSVKLHIVIPHTYVEAKSTVKQLASEEGLYVGERPKISQSRIRTMENRILKRKKQVSADNTSLGSGSINASPCRRCSYSPLA